MAMFNNDSNMAGIFRAKLVKFNESNMTSKIYIPSIHTINPYEYEEGSQEWEDCLKLLPEAQWCVYKYDGVIKHEDGALCFILFESGNIKKPIIISYFMNKIVYVSSSSGDSSGGSSSSGEGGNSIIPPDGVVGNGAELIVPDEYGIFQTYEKEILNPEDKYHGWSKTSNQYKLRKDAIDNNRMRRGSIFGLTNCAIIDDRLCVATRINIGGNFPVAIGDYIDVQFSNGGVWHCIIADAKGSDANSPWGHQNGKCVTEIIYWDYSGITGNQHNKISKIVKVGNYFNK